MSRVIERGVKGIETIVRFTMLNTAPVILEFAIVATVFTVMFGVSFIGVLVLIIVLYVWFTVRASNWRIGIRRAMNESDTEANSKAIDSLLNFETVKYFGNERMEAERFDDSMSRYEQSAMRIWTSLGYLNFGQGFIFWTGMTIIGVMSVQRVLSGSMSVGDFVLINTFMMQIYRPLNMIGFVYREIRQAPGRYRGDVQAARPGAGDSGPPERKAPVHRRVRCCVLRTWCFTTIPTGQSSRAWVSKCRRARPLRSSDRPERANPPSPVSSSAFTM